MKAIHLKCESEGIGLKGLSKVEDEKHAYTSCCWDIPRDTAKSLEGGWIYFHTTKNEPSKFGGVITSWEAQEPEPEDVDGEAEVDSAEDTDAVKTKTKAKSTKKAAKAPKVVESITFHFEARMEGKGQAWRGPGRTTAWTSGAIDAKLKHEKA